MIIPVILAFFNKITLKILHLCYYVCYLLHQLQSLQNINKIRKRRVTGAQIKAANVEVGIMHSNIWFQDCGTKAFCLVVQVCSTTNQTVTNAYNSINRSIPIRPPSDRILMGLPLKSLTGRHETVKSQSLIQTRTSKNFINKSKSRNCHKILLNVYILIIIKC